MGHQPLHLRASAGVFASWTWVRPLLFRSTLPVYRPGFRAQSTGAISGRDGVEASSVLRRCWHPCRGAGDSWGAAFLWCRFALPPATCSDASGIFFGFRIVSDKRLSPAAHGIDGHGIRIGCSSHHTPTRCHRPTKHPGGMPARSRWSSEAIPPVIGSKKSNASRRDASHRSGSEPGNGAEILRQCVSPFFALRRRWHPCRGAGDSWGAAFRWCRFALPPATCSDASGIFFGFRIVSDKRLSPAAHGIDGHGIRIGCSSHHTPTRCHRPTKHPGGMPARSRWSSEAIPPVIGSKKSNASRRDASHRSGSEPGNGAGIIGQCVSPFSVLRRRWHPCRGAGDSWGA